MFLHLNVWAIKLEKQQPIDFLGVFFLFRGLHLNWNQKTISQLNGVSFSKQQKQSVAAVEWIDHFPGLKGSHVGLVKHISRRIQLYLQAEHSCNPGRPYGVYVSLSPHHGPSLDPPWGPSDPRHPDTRWSHCGYLPSDVLRPCNLYFQKAPTKKLKGHRRVNLGFKYLFPAPVLSLLCVCSPLASKILGPHA